MSVCNLGHEHPDEMQAAAGPVVIDDGTAEAAESVSAAEVERARIEADRDVKVAKITSRAVDEEMVRRIAALEAEAEVFRTKLAPPEPEPVVIAQDNPEPEPAEPVPAPAQEEHKEPPATRKKSGFF
jgi:hypothetical protein